MAAEALRGLLQLVLGAVGLTEEKERFLELASGGSARAHPLQGRDRAVVQTLAVVPLAEAEVPIGVGLDGRRRAQGEQE